MIKLIAIHGRARSGKDTVAKHLRRQHGFRRMAFADAVRDTCAAAYGVPAAMFYDDDAKGLELPGWPGVTVRQALIDFGMGVRSAVHPDFWLSRWFNDFKQVPDYEPVVISDLRLPNEAALIRSLGGVVLHLRRPGEQVTHIVDAKGSEDGLPVEQGVDVELVNNASIEDLLREVNHLISFLSARRAELPYRVTE